MIRLLLPFFLVGSSSAFAATCQDRVLLTNAQIDTNFEILSDAGAMQLQIIRAYNELCRSDDAAIRDLAITIALESGSRALRAALLPNLLLERENLIVRPFDTGSLTQQQRDWIEANGPITLEFRYKDPDASCIGFNGGACSNHSLDYSGEGASIQWNGVPIEMSLTENGFLEGIMIPPGTGLRIPVRARLR